MPRFPLKCYRSAVLLAFGILLGTSVAAQAQSRICNDLENRLGSLQNGGSVTNNREYQRYNNAAQKLRKRLAGAQNQARRARCRTSGILLFQSRECSGLSGEVRQLERELRSLESKRSRFVRNPRSTRREQRDLVIALARNNCGRQYERAAARYGYRSNLFNRREEPVEEYRPPRVTHYRTVCVRICDGYFFPISTSTTAQNFSRDEAVCKEKFPETQVELFYHPEGVENAMETAQSMSGQPYSSQSYAFRYRETYDASCKFDRRRLQQTLLQVTGQSTAQSSNRRMSNVEFGQNGPVPLRRPVLGLDPETQMNLAGDFRPNALPLPAELVVDPQIRDGQRVRTVGPERFYGQSAAKVLSSPVRTLIQ
uniref:DUF2865 domain-containing protein n=1 Tax=Pararhizobium sp. IMCC3301 TaxID=3067904 RepID=UPI0027408D51|nr:DUF2865 domain-containing protein [Pararhizobium sp. IMCC3301]